MYLIVGFSDVYSMTLWKGDNQYERWEANAVSWIGTCPPEMGWYDCIIYASPTKQSFFLFIALPLSSSWHTVGNQETFARIKIEQMDHHLK